MRRRGHGRPTPIHLRVGPTYQGEIRLTRPLSRIGSQLGFEVRLSEKYAPPHLATIEVRGGDLTVHNKSGQIILVGDDEVAPEASRPWSEGETARLTPHVELWLGERPIPRSIGDSRRRPTAAPEAAASEGLKKTAPARLNAASLGLTAVILVALAALLFGNDGSDDSATTDQLAQLVIAAHGDEAGSAPADPLLAEVCLVIQSARAAELRGDPGLARTLYREARDVLLPARGGDGKFADPWLDSAFAFVRDRLRN